MYKLSIAFTLILLVLTTAYIIATSRVHGVIHNIYLDKDIEEPATAEAVINRLQTATKADTVVFHIACGGGNVDTTLWIINAIKATKAHTVMNIEGTTASGCSFIAFSGDEVHYSPYSSVLFHQSSSLGTTCTYLTGKVDRGQDAEAHCNAELRIYERLLNNFFSDLFSKGILTSEEIAAINRGAVLQILSDGSRIMTDTPFITKSIEPTIPSLTTAN